MYNKRVLSKIDLGKYSKPNPYSKDIITDPMGQWKYPGVPTRIPSSDITMQGVGYPVLGVADTGQTQMMMPGTDYTFPGANYVDEYPQAKKGGLVKMPKPSKKGLASKKFTNSVMGTSRLFTESPLFAKSKKKKNRIFDPNAKYYQDGGITTQEEIDAANNAMMKARLAYADMHGNPAAKRMVVAPDQPYDFGDGNMGTHYMASMDEYAVPQIQDVDGQLMLGDYGPESSEAIRLDNPEDAMYFAEHYKDIAPAFIETELTPEEIEEYRKGGFIVEDISVPQLTMQKGGEPKKKKRKTDDHGRYRSEDGNVRTPITPEMRAVMPPDEWSQYIQDVPEVYTTRTKEQQAAMNAARNMELLNQLNYQRAPHLYLPDGSLRPQAAQAADWFWQLGMTGPAALKAAGSLLAKQIPKTGITYGTALNTAAGIHGATQVPQRIQDWQDVAEGEKDWKEATAESLMTALELYGGYDAAKTLLPQTYKINPWAGRLGTYNRVVGDDAIADLQSSGLVRAGNYGGVKTDLGPFAGIRTTPHPSFGKGAPRQAYIDQTIQQGKTPFIISTDRPMRVSNLGSHGKGSTMFPVDETGKYMSAFSADDVKVFDVKPHWLKGYKEVPKELPGSPNSFESQIDWAKWNPDTPKYPELISEYNAIEETTKANGTWMKNADGSPYKGSPEQFIQEQSSWFKRAYPEGYDKTYRGVQTSTSKHDLTGSASEGFDNPNRGIFTADYDLASGYAGRNAEDKLLSVSDPEGTAGVFELIHPKGKQIDYNTQLDHWTDINLVKGVSKINLEASIAAKKAHLERLKKIDGVAAETIKNQEDIIKMSQDYLDNFDKIKSNQEALIEMRGALGDRVSTNEIAEYIPSTDLRKIKLRNINDGGYGDVTIVNARPGNYMKSKIGNVGFFDLNNPNIYKVAIPGMIGAGLMKGQQKEGGIITELTDDEIAEYKKGGWIVEEL